MQEFSVATYKMYNLQQWTDVIIQINKRYQIFATIDERINNIEGYTEKKPWSNIHTTPIQKLKSDNYMGSNKVKSNFEKWTKISF